MQASEWLWANPVLRREWARERRPAMRRGSVGRWLGLAALLLFYAAAAHWLSREERSPWEARTLLLGICLLYLLWVGATVPGPAASSISGERERRTWEALTLTALHASQLVSGKLLARLSPPVWALGMLLPLLLMSAHAARLSVPRVALIVVVLLASAVLAAAVALWVSGLCRRTRTAVVVAYLVVGLFFWGAVADAPALSAHGESLWWYLSPAWQAAILCLAEPSRSPAMRPLLPEWAWFLLACGAVTGVALALLTRRVGRIGE